MKLGKLLQRDLTTGLSRQRLMDSVTDTTEAALGNLPSNKTADYVRVIGSDGESYKIPRADFAGIIRSELGTILNGLSDQQTVTKVPTLNGSTLGASAVATLASVLGVKQYPVHLYTIESGKEKTVLCGYGLLIGIFPGGPQTMVSLVNNNNLTAISGSVSNLTFTRVTEYNLKITNSAASKVYIVIINNREDE